MRTAEHPFTYLGPDDAEPTDEALAHWAAAGNMRAVEELYRRHQGPVVSYLRRLTRDNDIAVDLFMEAFFRAYVNLKSFDPHRPFRPWLYRIASNVGLGWLRRHRRSLPPAGRPDGERPVFEMVAERELSRQVEEAVAELPDDQRTVFILRHYQGLSCAEISAVCGCPEGTVRSRMHYAVRVLRTRLRFWVERDDEP